MAKKEGYIIETNELKRIKDGVLGSPSDIRHGTTEKCILAIANGRRVFNKALYHLSMQDEAFLIDAAGTPVTATVESYKTEADGAKYPVSVSGNVIDLEPNKTDGLIEGTFTVTQTISGFELTGRYVQSPNSEVTEYLDLLITSVNYIRIPASGGSSTVSIGYRVTKRTTQSSGGSSDEYIYGSTTSFDSISGGTLVSGATFSSSSGMVTAETLGTSTTESDINVAVVNAVTITIHGITANWSGLAYCTQQQNVETRLTYYTVTCQSDVENCAATAIEIDFDVTAYKTVEYSYTSGVHKDPLVSKATATISTNLGDLNKSSITGEGTVTLTLGANTGDSARTATVTATCPDGTSASDSVTQASDNVTYRWDTPYITAILCQLDVPANGMGVPISASYTQNKLMVSQSSGTSIVDTISGTVTVDSASGESHANNAKISGALVSADAWGAQTESRTKVFTVTSATITVNGMTGTSSGKSCVVYQAENIVTSSITNYSLSLSASSNIPALGGSTTINVSATSTTKSVYSSGASSTSNPTSARATLSSSEGTLGSSSITGTGSTSFTVSTENLKMESVPYTITGTCGSETKTITVYQSAAVYVLSSRSIGTAPSTGGTMTFTVLSTRNGNPQAIDTSDVSVSGLSGITVQSVSHDGSGEYSITLANIPANTSTSSRTFKMTVTQPFSLKTLEETITQLGATVVRDDVDTKLTAIANTGYTEISYTVQFLATDTSKYQGGTLKNVYVRLNSKSDGSGTMYDELLISNSITVAEGSSSSVYSGSLINRNGTFPVYVLVYYNNAIKKYTIPVAEMT